MCLPECAKALRDHASVADAPMAKSLISIAKALDNSGELWSHDKAKAERLAEDLKDAREMSAALEAQIGVYSNRHSIEFAELASAIRRRDVSEAEVILDRIISESFGEQTAHMVSIARHSERAVFA